MDDRDSLPNKYVPEQWQTVKEGCGCRLVVHDFQRQVIDFEAISEVTDTFPSFISVGNNYDLVPSFNQALRELVNVAFHTSHIWVEKVRHHAYTMSTGLRSGNTCRATRGEHS